MIELHNIDCMDYMKTCKDNQFSLGIIDPPYGIGIDGQKKSVNKNPKHNRKEHIKKGWDSAIPKKEYFDELFRITENQIIWGANYLIEYLIPTKAWIFWYKGQNDLTMSDGEMAWTSFNKVTRQVTINRVELIKQNTFHPTEKPIKLYKWLLHNYAKEGDTIFDSHFGSLSIGIAAHDMKFNLVATEIDKDYFEAGKQRLLTHQQQLKIF